MKKSVLFCMMLISTVIAGCRETPKPDDVRHISFTTDDGVTIYADYYHPPKPSPLLILLHMYGQSRQTWEPAIDDWFGRGFAICAIDMRGHGESTKQDGKPLRYTHPKRPEDNMFLHAWKDVDAALQYLQRFKRCETDRTILIGASIGCTVAIDAGGKLDAVQGAVLMSPGTNYLNIDTTQLIDAYAPKPVLMVSDETEAPACETLRKEGGYDENTQYIFPGAGHGTNMFESAQSKKIIRTIGTWLEKNFL